MANNPGKADVRLPQVTEAHNPADSGPHAGPPRPLLIGQIMSIKHGSRLPRLPARSVRHALLQHLRRQLPTLPATPGRLPQRPPSWPSGRRGDHPRRARLHSVGESLREALNPRKDRARSSVDTSVGQLVTTQAPAGSPSARVQGIATTRDRPVSSSALLWLWGYCGPDRQAIRRPGPRWLTGNRQSREVPWCVRKS